MSLTLLNYAGKIGPNPSGSGLPPTYLQSEPPVQLGLFTSLMHKGSIAWTRPLAFLHTMQVLFKDNEITVEFHVSVVNTIRQQTK